MTASKGRIHFVIGDTQVKPGVPLDHLTWIGRFLVDQFAGKDVRVIHLGDHFDFPSLSSYDKGKAQIEGLRVIDDLEVGNRGIALLSSPLWNYNRGKAKARQWWPSLDYFEGNHDDRAWRLGKDNPQLDGLITKDSFNWKQWGWKVHPFLKPATIDGIAYAHYFYNPNTGRPYSGENLETRLRTIGRSFSQGHQQGLKVATRYVGDRRHQGLVLGTTYLHDERYLGHQGNDYWRGIMVCHNVERGQYDRMEVSLDFLCRKYTGKPLRQFMKTVAPVEPANDQERLAA